MPDDSVPNRPCSATAEQLCPDGHVYLIRVHAAPAAVYGDPWIWACTVSRESPDHPDAFTAVLKGVDAPPKASWMRAVAACLKELGFRRVAYERYRDTAIRRVVWDL